MNYTRWYDKDQYLKFIMDTIENVKDELKRDIVNDFIQIIMQDSCSDMDGFINKINNEYVSDRHRWYDKDESISSVVEMLKFVDEEKKKELLKELVDILMQYKNKVVEQ